MIILKNNKYNVYLTFNIKNITNYKTYNLKNKLLLLYL